MTQPKTQFLKDYRKPEFECLQLYLEFDLHTEVTWVTTKSRWQRTAMAKDLCLHGEQLELLQLQINGEEVPEAAYQVTSQHLLLRDVPNEFELTTRVRIDPGANQQLSGLYQSSGNFCTQCESEGFRRITYFLDRPDVMTVFTVTIEADSQRFPYLLSNGDLRSEEQLPNGRHRAVWHDPWPKPCYLFALVAGDFAVRQSQFTTKSGRHVDLYFYVEHGHEEQLAYAIESLRQSMAWDERAYGREYDLDRYSVVAVSDFNFGAMENKSLNIFNTKYVLADPDTAVDQDYVNVQAVIGHEYFHNWSGNRVTCRDWFQISLKEGFTVFREHAFTADMVSAGVKRVQDAEVMRQRQFSEASGPMSHPVQPQSYIDINNFYTLTVYNKGAELIRMMWLLIGPQKFRQAMDLYFSRHDGQAVTIEHFIRSIEDSASVDLQQFRRWYRVAHTPEVSVELVYDADKKQCRMRFSQVTQGCQEPLPIPIEMALLDHCGREQTLKIQGNSGAGSKQQLLILTECQQEWVFEGIETCPVPSVLRGFSAPVQLRMTLSDEDLMVLSCHDHDPYNRWDAVTQLATRAIFSFGDDRFETLCSLVGQAYAHLLEHHVKDLLMLVKCLSLPAEAYCVLQQTPCDVDRIVAGRLALHHYLATTLAGQWQTHYRIHHDPSSYAPTVAAMGKRAMQNICLSYLSVHKDEEALGRCSQQYHTANNLTLRLGALEALRDVPGAVREDALADFYQRGEGQPLVRDRWFQLQAESRLADSHQRIRDLLKHADFNWQNPNRVRSVLGAFCQNNHPVFHHISGQGYEILADSVVLLDGINSSTAARILEPLTQWRRFDTHRAELMKKELRRVQAAVTSKGVIEVVSKALGNAETTA